MKRKRESKNSSSQPSNEKDESEDENEGNVADAADAADDNGSSSAKRAKKGGVSRREVYKEVASKRAAHFARSESSTTPTGSLRKKSKDQTEEEEVWPGPWTTAAMIIQKRDAAKKEREDKIKSGENGSIAEAEELDVYDEEVSKLHWTPVIRNIGERQTKTQLIPSLADLCCEVIAKHIEDYESEGGLEYLSNEQREKISESLAKIRRFDDVAAMKLSAIPNNNSIIFPDCSQLDEDTFMKIIERVCFPESDCLNLDQPNLSLVSTSSAVTASSPTVHTLHRGVSEIVHHSISALQYLSLRNCGRGFTDRVAALLVNGSHSLEEVSLEGCFRLSDEGVIKLLEGCAQTIRSLALTSNPRLSVRCVEKISELSHLRSLRLDYVSHLTDEALQPLLAGMEKKSSHIPPLQELSLRGVTELSSKCLVDVVELFGRQLQVLDLSECKVNDIVIIGIRNACTTLSKLLLEQLDDVSSTALMGLFIPDRHAATTTTIEPDPSSANTPSTSNMTQQQMKNRGMKFISGSIGPLEMVSFQGTSNVSDDVIVQLCENYSKTLQSLNLNGCNLLTTRSMAALWLRCNEELQVLDLSFVRNISEDAIGYLVERCHRLKRLSVWGCTQLSQRFYSHLESSTHLQSNLQIIGRISL